MRGALGCTLHTGLCAPHLGVRCGQVGFGVLLTGVQGRGVRGGESRHGGAQVGVFPMWAGFGAGVFGSRVRAGSRG